MTNSSLWNRTSEGGGSGGRGSLVAPSSHVEAASARCHRNGLGLLEEFLKKKKKNAQTPMCHVLRETSSNGQMLGSWTQGQLAWSAASYELAFPSSCLQLLNYLRCLLAARHCRVHGHGVAEKKLLSGGASWSHASAGSTLSSCSTDSW